MPGILRALLSFFFSSSLQSPNTEGLSPARSFYSRVAGVTHPNPDGSSRQVILFGCRVGEELILVHEPSDEFPEAIAIYRKNGEQLGLIPSETAWRLSEDLDDGVVVTCEISSLTGGVKGKPNRGCNIEITIWED